MLKKITNETGDFSRKLEVIKKSNEISRTEKVLIFKIEKSMSRFNNRIDTKRIN